MVNSELPDRAPGRAERIASTTGPSRHQEIGKHDPPTDSIVIIGLVTMERRDDDGGLLPSMPWPTLFVLENP